MSFAWHEIRDHLMHSSSTLGFQRNFERLRCGEDVLRRFSDPSALLDALHRGGNTSSSKNYVLKALVEAAQADGPLADCALTLMLLALWPGLDAVLFRLKWRRLGRADDHVSDLLAGTTDAIRRLDLRRVNRVAATILMNVERDVVRTHQRDTDRQRHRSGIDPDQIAGDLDSLSKQRLRSMVHHLNGADAQLLIRVAVHGASQAEAGQELGLSEAASRKRYQRMTQRLRESLKHSFQ